MSLKPCRFNIGENHNLNISLLLSPKEIRDIGEENIYYISNNINSSFYVTKICKFLKKTRYQGSNIVELIKNIGVAKTINLIDNVGSKLLSLILTNVDIEQFSKIFEKYEEDKIINTINQYLEHQIRIQKKENELISALNMGLLPGIITDLHNIASKVKNFIKTLKK